MDGREAGTMWAVREADNRCLVFDHRRSRSPSVSIGSKLAEASTPSFVFLQALDEATGNSHAFERITKKMPKTLFKGCRSFGTSADASRASIIAALEEDPGAVSLTGKRLNQRVYRLRSLGHTCTAVAVYLEVHNEVVRCLIYPTGSSFFVWDGSAYDIFSLEMHAACTGSVVHPVDDRCLLSHHKAETESDHCHEQLTCRSFATAKRDQNSMFKALDKTSPFTEVERTHLLNMFSR
ncbi:hypothetical protein HPB51_018141 [Rhipicephalus microplus]|uniref:Uncharacterized protein n=1 Tax=Rhipicephalus microplus TaxID=6941 RepID=A0A9J6DAY8_RHIMP|nr:hypothetical protein HPB51_018141 [Rhipicephalus microplus]